MTYSNDPSSLQKCREKHNAGVTPSCQGSDMGLDDTSYWMCCGSYIYTRALFYCCKYTQECFVSTDVILAQQLCLVLYTNLCHLCIVQVKKVYRFCNLTKVITHTIMADWKEFFREANTVNQTRPEATLVALSSALFTIGSRS